MEKSKKNVETKVFWDTQIFWLELVLAALIPFIAWAVLTPTNILNSSVFFKLPAYIGEFGVAAFFSGIPVGIVGIKAAKGMKKRRIATMILSILNLLVGLIELAVVIGVFYVVLFKGVSV